MSFFIYRILLYITFEDDFFSDLMEELLSAPAPRRRIQPKQIIGFILLLALAATFFFSAYTKLIKVEPFEWAFWDLGIHNNSIVVILARLLIGLEAMLGLLLLAHVYLKSVTYPAILAFLGIMTAYLLIILVRQGNTGSCGCFGEAIPMSPLEAIGKNVIMAGIVLLLMKIYAPKPYRHQEIIAVVLGMAGFVIPFVTLPLSQRVEPIDLNPLYTTPGNGQPPLELRTGKHIIAFMSLTCPHCRKAAVKFEEIHKQYPQIPLFMVLNGMPADEKDFFSTTHSSDVPHMRFVGMDVFIKMSGPYVPAIFWVNNSIKERKTSYLDLSAPAMKHWAEQQ
ncbi:MauE/DoxX family redox-associated membrane protein [Chitinophagaceae bacterium MMS25-I14]